MQIYLSDFKLTMQKTPQNFYYNFYSKEFKNKFIPFNCPIDLFGILPKDFASDNSIECSFSLQLKEKILFLLVIIYTPFNISRFS